MAKQGKTTVAPKLRFPNFRKSKWSSAELSRLASFVTERVGTTECIPYTVSSGEGLISQQEKLGRTIAGKSIKNYIVLQHDDFAYNKSATKAYPQGFIARYKGTDRAAVPNSIFTCFRIDSHIVRPAYLDYLFSSNLHGKWLRTRITVGARAHGSLNVNVDDLMTLPVPLPDGASSLDEQQKIVDCLSSLDELITAQGRKVEALKIYKRGLMQQLFPRSGVNLPHLRFPEFVDSSSWHSQKIGSLLSKAVFAVNVAPEKTYREIGIRSHGKGIFHKEPVLGKIIGEKRVFQVVQGALVLNIVFAWEQAVATTSANEVGMIASHRFPMYVAEPGKCDVEYIKNFFLTKEGKRLLGAASPGGAGRNKTLGQKEFEKLEIVLPVSVDEQTKIAKCLSSLDTKIAIESVQLKTLKAHKMGLMNQLFPVPDENKA